MGYEKIIHSTNKIIYELEKTSSRGYASALKNCIKQLNDNKDVKNTLEYLWSAATAARALKDVYVVDLDIGDWHQLIINLRLSVEEEMRNRSLKS